MKIDINKNNKSDISEIKHRVFEIIQIGTRVDILSTVFDIIISFVIVLSIVVTFLHTFDSLAAYRPLFTVIEKITTVIFVIEYILRIWTSDLLYPKCPSPKCSLKYIFSFYGIVDLLTIISYFSTLFSNGFVTFKIVRVVRVLRLFKVNRQSDAFNVVSDVIYEKRSQIVSSMFMVFMLMLAASLCMYGIEHDAQPDVFSNAFSGIWWAMSTVLTVGYGDIYPITAAGKIVAIFIAIFGVGVVAIPTGLISAGFVEYYTKLNIAGNTMTLSDTTKDLLNKQAKEAGLNPADYIERILIEKDILDRQNKK